MSEIDDSLARLFRAAKTAPPDLEATPPLGFATRVLAEVRSGSPGDTDFGFAAICRRAVLCSCGAALLFLLLNLQSLKIWNEMNAWHAADARLVDSAMQVSLP